MSVIVSVMDEMEWCMNRGAYLKNKKVLSDIEYDDMVEIFGTPSRINPMINNSTSLMTDRVITHFEENRRYHIEWHCRIEDRYFMVMGLGVNNNSREWAIYYSDDSCEDMEDLIGSTL